MRGRLIRCRGLQRALAKPSQLHPLCAATGKGEGKERGRRRVPQALCAAFREDMVCVAPVPLQGQHPQEVSSTGSSLSV